MLMGRSFAKSKFVAEKMRQKGQTYCEEIIEEVVESGQRLVGLCGSIAWVRDTLEL